MLIEEIQKALRETDRPLQDIAEEIGVHRVNLSKFKAGNTGFSVDTLEKLAKALNLKIVVKSRKRA